MMKIVGLTGILLVFGVLVGLVAVGINFWGIGKRKVVVERAKVRFEIPRENIQKVELENGMKVVVFQTSQAPKVLVQIAYDVGSAAEESGERGLAHLLEHMIFKGTQKLNEGDIDSIARKYGADFNAYTAHDVTSYYFEINKNNWKHFLPILADCMQNARFDEQHLASELKAVIQELRMYKDNHFSRMVEKACDVIFPSNHPYHHPVIGYKQDLVAVSGKKLHEFYRKYYQPNKAIVFIVGDVNKDEAISLARETFGNIKTTQKSPTTIFPHSDGDIVSSTNCLYEEVNKELLGFFWKIPGLCAKNDVLTSIVEGVLGSSGEGSVLSRILVDEEKLATNVSVGAMELKEEGLFFVFVQPKDGCREKCRNSVARELQNIIARGVDELAVTKVVRGKERDFFSMMQSASSLTREWIQSFFSSDDEFAIFKKIDDMYAIDGAAVQEYVKTYLDPFLMNELDILPLPENKKQLWVENKQRSDQLDQEILKKHQRSASLEEPKLLLTMPNPKSLEFSFPKPDREMTFSNGLKVLLCRVPYVPLINVVCSFKEASYLANAKEGIALEVMMNMLMEGSKGLSKAENVDFFESHGAIYGFDASGAKVKMVNVDYLPVLQRMYTVLTKPDFCRKALEKIQTMNIDSFERLKDEPSRVASRMFRSMVYKNHPFAWSYDDAIDLVKNLTVNDLEQLHKKYISPANMTLVISGDIDLNIMQKDIELAFGSWRGGSCQAIACTAGAFVPREQKDQKMLRDQVFLLLGQASPVTIYDADNIPLSLLSYISFCSLGSRLYELRERTGLFYRAGGGWGQGATKVHGYDYVSALLSIDKIDQAEVQMRSLIDEIGANGVTQEELEDARQWYLKGLIDLVTNGGAIAGTLAALEEFGLGFDYYDKVLHRVQNVSVAELNQICKKYFSSSNLARVRVGRLG